LHIVHFKHDGTVRIRDPRTSRGEANGGKGILASGGEAASDLHGFLHPIH
jgi:hypothetical protein